MSTVEERFFGVKNQVAEREGDKIAAPGDEAPEVEVEVIEDGEQRPEAKPIPDELDEVSKSVRNRINKLTLEKHEERRQREAAERMREEAVRVAQELSKQSQEYQRILQQGESALLGQIKERVSLALDRAKAEYKLAHEEGNTDKLVSAQDAMSRAYAELREVESRERQIQGRQPRERDDAPATNHQAQQAPATQAQQQPAQPQLSDRQRKWAEDNPWFSNPDYPDMTALAYGIHEKLVKKEGVSPNSDDYYSRIDAEMRKKFPEYFATGGNADEGHSGAATQVRQQPNTVVAPGGRNNGSASRKVQLTSTQVQLARRLGISPEQYALQLIKERQNG